MTELSARSGDDRKSRIRGAASPRLRGAGAGAAGTIYSTEAVAGIVLQPHTQSTMMLPGPRPNPAATPGTNKNPVVRPTIGGPRRVRG